MSYEVHQVEGAARFGAADRTRVDRRSQWWILGMLFVLLGGLGGLIVVLYHTTGGADVVAVRTLADEVLQQSDLAPGGGPVVDRGVLQWSESSEATDAGPSYEGTGVVIGRTGADVLADIEAALGPSWEAARGTVDDGQVLTGAGPDGTTLRATVRPLDDDDRVALPGRVDEAPATEPATHLVLQVARPAP